MKWFDGFDNAIERALNAQSMDKARYSISAKGGLAPPYPPFIANLHILLKHNTSDFTL